MRAHKLGISDRALEAWLERAGLSETEAGVYTLMVGRGYSDRLARLVEDLEYFFPPVRGRRQMLARAIEGLVRRGVLTTTAGTSQSRLDVREPWEETLAQVFPSAGSLDPLAAEAVRLRRAAMLLTPVGPAASPIGREQFREFVRRATDSIRLGVYSSATAFPEIRDLVREKLLAGVRVEVLMLSPQVAAELEQHATLRDDVIRRTADWRKLARAAERQKNQGAIRFQLRWLQDSRFAAFSRVMLIDDRAWLLTVHRTGRQRAVEGFVYTDTGELGRTNLYRILDHYWTSAWARAVDPHRKTRVFIGSSTRGLPVARALETLLADAGTSQVTVWEDHFRAGRFTLEELGRALDESEFALLVLTGDDEKIVRSLRTQTPRDNVIFELGMFMTRLGRQRTMFICAETRKGTGQSASPALPTDLAGVTMLKFQEPCPPTGSRLLSTLRGVANTVIGRIHEYRRDFPSDVPRRRT